MPKDKKRPDFSPVRVNEHKEADQLLKDATTKGILDSPRSSSRGSVSSESVRTASRTGSPDSSRSSSSLDDHTMKEVDQLLKEASTAHQQKSRSLDRVKKPAPLNIEPRGR